MVNIVVAVGFVCALATAVLYETIFDSGCSGGHVWGEWEDARRIKSVPYYSGRAMGVQCMMERTCQCEGCDASEESWNNPHKVPVGDRVVIENTEDGVEVHRP